MNVLVCSVDHPGTRTQARGIARAFEDIWRDRHPGHRVRIVDYKWWHRSLARIGLFRPSLIVSCGASGERRARRQRHLAPGAVWCHVELADPDGARPDLNVVPQHDWHPDFDGRTDMMPVPGVPHEVTPAIRDRQAAARRSLGLLVGQAAVAMLIGGPNPAFRYDEAATDRILDLVGRVRREGGVSLVTGSRRTPKALMDRLSGMAGPGVVVWTGAGANPYRQFLAAADAFHVTEDSISMTCEALATGQPVSIVALSPVPGERLDKFRRFQAGFAPWLQQAGDEVAFMAPQPGPRPLVPNAAQMVARRLVDVFGKRDLAGLRH